MRLFQDESASWLECGLESSRHHRSRCQAPQRGTLIVAGGFQADTAAQRLREGRAHLTAFGRKFIANPDLPERLRVGGPFNADDPTTY